MDGKDLVTMLLKKNYFGGDAELPKDLSASESHVEYWIKEINDRNPQYGFKIEHIHNKGYFIKIDDYKKFNMYLNRNNLGQFKQTERSKIILFNLFQTEGYITINTLSNIANVSRNTIVSDLTEVEEFLTQYHLDLYRKKHYGLKIIGEEKNYRKAFSKLIHNNDFNILPSSDYTAFLKKNYQKSIQNMLLELIENEGLDINDVAYSNLVQHIEILLYRTWKQNYIVSETTSVKQHEEEYFNIAKQIGQWIYDQFHIELPYSEIKLLSAHIAGKAMTSNLKGQEKNELKNEIEKVLSVMDQEFSTSFSKDNVLKSNLLMHVYPLMKRIYHNMELENPFIEKIYSKYSNVFLFSYRFSELITKKYSNSLSRDEVGYIALHFATHLEREKKEVLNKYKRIIIICATGRGSANLIKIKLQDIFPYADIHTTSLNTVSNNMDPLPDLFISTIPVEEEINGVPVINVKEFLDDYEVEKIKNILSILDDFKGNYSSRQSIKSLFIKKLFYRIKTDDYMELIGSMADDVKALNYADSDFPNSVIQRELMFTTIYSNGVAGPHSKHFYAATDCVSVAILDEPVMYMNKKVQIIFLINLQKGHLFLHKEVSKFILSVIENEHFRKRILSCKDYESFIRVIENLG